MKRTAHFAFANDFAERLYCEVDNVWRGELPLPALVGADGGGVTMIGAIDDYQITAWFDAAGKAGNPQSQFK